MSKHNNQDFTFPNGENRFSDTIPDSYPSNGKQAYESTPVPTDPSIDSYVRAVSSGQEIGEA